MGQQGEQKSDFGGEENLLGKSELSIHDELLDRVINAYNLEEDDYD